MTRSALKRRLDDALVLSYDEGDVTIRPLPDGRFRVSVMGRTEETFVPQLVCDTDLSEGLIEALATEDPLWTPSILNRYNAEGEEAQALLKQLEAYL